MEKLDKEFTAKIESWLSSDHKTEDKLREGANMVYLITHNTAMYNQIIRRPKYFADKIEYELKKHLRYRLDGLTLQGVRDLDAEITPVIERASKAVEEAVKVNPDEEVLPTVMGTEPDTSIKARGRRPDHDNLPENIQKIWPANAERWKKIKQNYETCKSLDKACDRYEYLKVLKDTWYTYKSEMHVYDSYKLDLTSMADSESATSMLANQVGNARSYISKNLQKFIDAHTAAGDTPTDEQNAQLKDMYEKIQQRVDILTSNDAPMGDDLRRQLEKYEFIKPLDDEPGETGQSDTQAAQE